MLRVWLRDLRLKKKMQQQELATLLNLSVQQYSYLERGDRMKDMPLSLATKIANVFRVPLKRISELEQYGGKINGN